MTSLKTAHDLKCNQRTDDIRIDDDVNFDGLLLTDAVLKGLKSAGFVRPSPIQLKAIPLGRCGLDLIVQAKSGTGKTCVFSVIALDGLVLENTSIQVLIVAPTREIAVQIWEVINAIGSSLPQLRCYTFIGGMPVVEDTLKLKKCHVAVGTPGRLKQLVELGALHTKSVRLFVLDEADKLMEENMQEDINWLYSQLPDNKQMLAVSATYPEVLAQHLTVYMRNPTFIRLNAQDPSLLGIRQYYRAVLFHPLQQKSFSNKVSALTELLSQVEFRQCLIFSNYQLRAQNLADKLTLQGWPATFICGSQDQQHRLTAMARLKRFKCRVLVSTDLTSRGIDAEHVNLVVNLDLPKDHETYLHRIGRAGRFGTYGAAVTFVTLGKEMDRLKELECKCNTKILVLPAPAPPDLACSSGFVNINHLVTSERLNTENEGSEQESVTESTNTANDQEKILLSQLEIEAERELLNQQTTIDKYAECKKHNSLTSCSLQKTQNECKKNDLSCDGIEDNIDEEAETALNTGSFMLSPENCSEQTNKVQSIRHNSSHSAAIATVTEFLNDNTSITPASDKEWSLNQLVDQFKCHMVDDSKQSENITQAKVKVPASHLTDYITLAKDVNSIVNLIKSENKEVLVLNSNAAVVEEVHTNGCDLILPINLDTSTRSTQADKIPSDHESSNIEADDHLSNYSTVKSQDSTTDHLSISQNCIESQSKINIDENVKSTFHDDLSLGQEYMQLLKCVDAVSRSDAVSTDTDFDEVIDSVIHSDSPLDGYLSDNEDDNILLKDDLTKKYNGRHKHKKAIHYENTIKHTEPYEVYNHNFPKNGEFAPENNGEQMPSYGSNTDAHCYDYHGHSSNQPHYNQQLNSENYEFDTEYYNQAYNKNYPATYPNIGNQATNNCDSSYANWQFWAGWHSCHAHWSYPQSTIGYSCLASHHRHMYTFHQQQAELFKNMYKSAARHEKFARNYHHQMLYIKNMAKHEKRK